MSQDHQFILIDSASSAFSYTSPPNRFGGSGQGRNSIRIHNRSITSSTCSCPRSALWHPRSGCLSGLCESGVSFEVCKLSRYQVPVPPLYRLVTGLITLIFSRLVLLLVGIWWIPVELVTRKRGQVVLYLICLFKTNLQSTAGERRQAKDHGILGQEISLCPIGSHG